ncbi:unnamed protein product [Laminaria digitata]
MSAQLFLHVYARSLLKALQGKRMTTASEHHPHACAFYSRQRPHTEQHGCGGAVCGGVTSGGVIYDGNICGGVICGGVFCGGSIGGGVRVAFDDIIVVAR